MAAVNAVVFGLDVALSEGLVLAERAGVERERAYDVFRRAPSAPRSSPTSAQIPSRPNRRRRPSLTRREGSGLITLGDAVAVRLAQAEVNLELIRTAASTLGGGRDFAEVATHLRESSG
jgi:3-hydroxyisobutyrate dehydrogenase-like beta-hydroxyacid dehydrogenase